MVVEKQLCIEKKDNLYYIILPLTKSKTLKNN